MRLSKIEIIVSPEKTDDIRIALSKAGIGGMTVLDCAGCGVQNGTLEYELEKHEEMVLLPKKLLMFVVEEEKTEALVEMIKKELYTGHIGDGKIFISPVSNAIRVRTGQEGSEALN